MKAQYVHELEVYQEGFDLQQEIFHCSKRWPKEETYSLTDQIRRSSRSIGANLAEGWAKRRYPANFVSKLSDADGELAETRHWLLSAYRCEYLDDRAFEEFDDRANRVGKLLGSMILKYEAFCLPESVRRSVRR